MLFLLNESTSYAPKGPQATFSLNRGQGEDMIEYRIGEAFQAVRKNVRFLIVYRQIETAAHAFPSSIIEGNLLTLYTLLYGLLSPTDSTIH